MIKCHSRERSYAAGIKWIAYSSFLFHYYSDPTMEDLLLCVRRKHNEKY